MKEKELAVNVFCYVDEHRGPSTFNVVVLARPGKDLKEVEKGGLRRDGPPENRAGGRLGTSESSHMRSAAQTRSNSKARCTAPIRSARWRSIYGDPESHQHPLRTKSRASAKQDIQRVAKTYLTEENRTVVTTLPKPRPKRRRPGRPAQ